MKSEESWGRLVMRYKLSDVMELIGGGTPKTSKAEYWNGEIPWLSVKDFNNDFRYVYETEKSITELGLNNSSTKLLKEGDIIISARGTVGEIATIPFPMAFNQSCYGLRAKEEVVTSDFLYYLIKHNVYILKKNTHGSVFDTITRDTFSGIEVDIPSLDEQRKIASILSEIDEKIELNNEINKNLEQQAFAIFNEMFVDSIYGENFVGDILTPNRGKGLLSKDAVPGNVPVVAGGLEPATYHNQSNTVAPVLTISASGANAGYVNLWNIPVWSSDSSFIDTNMTENVYFWYAMLKSRQSEIFDAQTGSAQPHIYPKHIARLPMGNIRPDEINQYTVLVSPLFEAIGANKEENLSLASMRDALLPKLMSGEIDVTNIDL